MIEVLVWTTFSLLLMSFIEYSIHRWLMHKSLFGKRLNFFWKIYHRHKTLHHFTYYRTFNKEDDPEGRETDITLDIWLGVILSLPIWAGLAYFFGLTAGVCFLWTIIAHHWIWSIIHNEMHNPAGRWFSGLSLYKYLQRYHEMHHRYTGKNFNVVLPFWDFVLGTHIAPSENDYVRFSKLGI